MVQIKTDNLKKKLHRKVKISGENVEIINNHKHLGVTLLSDGNWTTHIDNITTSALKQVYVLKFTLSKKSLSNIYITFIRPLLEYACKLWDGCFEYDSEKIEKNTTRSCKNSNRANEIFKFGSIIF